MANSLKVPSSPNAEGHLSFDAFQTVEFVHWFDSALPWHGLEKLRDTSGMNSLQKKKWKQQEKLYWILVQQDVIVFSLLHICRQLYRFRVLTPIIRSSYNCNYSFWHWSVGSTTIRSLCWEKLCDRSIKSNASKCPVSIPSCTKPSSCLTPVPSKHMLFLRPPKT